MDSKEIFHKLWEKVDYSQKRIPFNEDEFNDLCDVLYQVQPTFKNISITLEKYDQIFLSNENFELRLRSEQFPVHTIVVAVIGIEPAKKGIGTVVINWMKEYALRKEYKRIVLESVNTIDGIQFAKRRGFTKCYSPMMEQISKSKEVGDYELILN